MRAESFLPTYKPTRKVTICRRRHHHHHHHHHHIGATYWFQPWQTQQPFIFASLAVSWLEFLSRVKESASRQPNWWIRPPYLCPLETGWSSYTSKHWVSIILASYDRHCLRWGYSCSLPSHGILRYVVDKILSYNKPV